MMILTIKTLTDITTISQFVWQFYQLTTREISLEKIIDYADKLINN
ncbi:MAG: hypothetical protein ACTS8H_00215 [Arsenophonus sp. NC-PE1-MAG3]